MPEHYIPLKDERLDALLCHCDVFEAPHLNMQHDLASMLTQLYRRGTETLPIHTTSLFHDHKSVGTIEGMLAGLIYG